MELRKLALVPAALALALYGYGLQGGTEATATDTAQLKNVAQLETDTGTDGGKNGGGEGGGGHDKSGGDNGGGGHDKSGGDNGGGGHDKNGGGNGGGGHDKNGGGNGGGPKPSPRVVVVKIGGGGGGGGGGTFFHCRIDGEVFNVGSRRACDRLRWRDDGGEEVVVVRKVRKARRVVVAEAGGEVVVRRKVRRVVRTVVVDGGASTGVRYYGSRAAVMQAERRGRSGSSYGGVVTGYNYGNGVAVTGNGNNVIINGNVYVNNGGMAMGSSKRSLRKKKRRVVMQDYGYEGGEYVTKGGGY